MHGRTTGKERESSDTVRRSLNVTGKKYEYNFMKEFLKTNISGEKNGF